MQTMTTNTASDVMKLESAHVLQTYRRAPVVFERGKGCRLYDAGKLTMPQATRLAELSRVESKGHCCGAGYLSCDWTNDPPSHDDPV